MCSQADFEQMETETELLEIPACLKAGRYTECVKKEGRNVDITIVIGKSLKGESE